MHGWAETKTAKNNVCKLKLNNSDQNDPFIMISYVKESPANASLVMLLLGEFIRFKDAFMGYLSSICVQETLTHINRK